MDDSRRVESRPKSVINTVLYCTSPLQVVNFKAAIEYLQHKDGICRTCFVVIAHSACLERTKQMIDRLGGQIGCASVLDLSHLSSLAAIHNGHRLAHETKEGWIEELLEKLKARALTPKQRVEQYKEALIEIVKTLESEVGTIHEHFVRANYQPEDGIFLSAAQKGSDTFLIEDGHGDYLPPFWAYRTFNFHNIAHAWRHKFYSSMNIIAGGMLTGEFKIARGMYFRPPHRCRMRFTNLPGTAHTDIGERVKENVAKLYINRPINRRRKVVIYGTIVVQPGYGITRRREVDIYNQVIEWICKEDCVSKDEIWYRPHPRCPDEEWKFMRQNLICRVLGPEELDLGEVALINPFLKAVYSVGSTSLVYAHVLFGKKARLIDIRREEVHPAAFEIYYTIAKRFGIRPIPHVWR